MEKVNDGRADFHLLGKESKKKVEGNIHEIIGYNAKLDMDIISDTLPLWKDKADSLLKA